MNSKIFKKGKIYDKSKEIISNTAKKLLKILEIYIKWTIV